MSHRCGRKNARKQSRGQQFEIEGRNVSRGTAFHKMQVTPKISKEEVLFKAPTDHNKGPWVSSRRERSFMEHLPTFRLHRLAKGSSFLPSARPLAPGGDASDLREITYT